MKIEKKIERKDLTVEKMTDGTFHVSIYFDRERDIYIYLDFDTHTSKYELERLLLNCEVTARLY